MMNSSCCLVQAYGAFKVFASDILHDRLDCTIVCGIQERHHEHDVLKSAQVQVEAPHAEPKAPHDKLKTHRQHESGGAGCGNEAY